MLIKSFNERCQRQEAKQRKLLGFFRDEIWTSAYNTSLLMGCSLSAAYKSLKQMELRGFLHCHTIEEINLKVWGVTANGLFNAWDNEELKQRTSFQPSKINALFVKHHLDLQIIMLNSTRAGYTHWINGKLLPKEIKQRPDAVVKDVCGYQVAVEYERTVKSRKRYEIIFSKYLQAIKQGEYSYVQYVCPDDAFASRLNKLFASIASVPVANQRVTLTDKHRSKIRISSIPKWPNR
ncbi:MAG: hypothetical protein ACI9T7_000662 [Oleiphilaceae bacterium]|jgi:hypothetical protein